jgi:hypothetical protein
VDCLVYSNDVRYHVQFVAGLGGLVKRCLDVDLRRVQIVFDDDSCAILDSESTPRQVAALSYVRNSFLVLAETRRATLAAAVPRLISQLDQPEVAGWLPRIADSGSWRPSMASW